MERPEFYSNNEIEKINRGGEILIMPIVYFTKEIILHMGRFNKSTIFQSIKKRNRRLKIEKIQRYLGLINHRVNIRSYNK